MPELAIYEWLYGEFDTVLTSYIAGTSGDVVAAITPTAYIMFGIYVVLWGFSMVRGLIDEPVMDGLMRLVKMAIILGFALGTGRYQTEIVTFFTDTPTQLANYMTFGSDSAASGGISTAQALDNLINATIDTAGAAWDKMSFLNPGTAFGLGVASIIILLGGLAFTVSAGVAILVSKIAMALLLALGPVFILMLMFKSTQRFFEQWFHQVLNYMIMLVLLLAVTSLFLRMCQEIITNSQAVIDSDPLQAVTLVVVVSISCLALLMNVPQIASALAGGLGLQTATGIGRRVGGVATAGRVVAGAAMAKATGGASVAARAVQGLVRASNAIRRT